jgi:hypothetical protein
MVSWGDADIGRKVRIKVVVLAFGVLSTYEERGPAYAIGDLSNIPAGDVVTLFGVFNGSTCGVQIGDRSYCVPNIIVDFTR